MEGAGRTEIGGCCAMNPRYGVNDCGCPVYTREVARLIPDPLCSRAAAGVQVAGRQLINAYFGVKLRPSSSVSDIASVGMSSAAKSCPDCAVVSIMTAMIIFAN